MLVRHPFTNEEIFRMVKENIISPDEARKLLGIGSIISKCNNGNDVICPDCNAKMKKERSLGNVNNAWACDCTRID